MKQIEYDEKTGELTKESMEILSKIPEPTIDTLIKTRQMLKRFKKAERAIENAQKELDNAIDSIITVMLREYGELDNYMYLISGTDDKEFNKMLNEIKKKVAVK